VAVRPIADRTDRPAVLYGRLEIAIGVFGVLSPLVLGLAHWLYLGTAAALALDGSASVALRFGLPLWSCSSPRRSWWHAACIDQGVHGDDRSLLNPRSAAVRLEHPRCQTGTALAGFFLIEFVGVRFSLWATAAINLAIGIVRSKSVRSEARGECADCDVAVRSAPETRSRSPRRHRLRCAARRNRVDQGLVMIVGGSRMHSL